MGGWLRHFALKAQERTGLSTAIFVWLIIAAAACVAAVIFFVVAAFIWLAQRYDPLIASLLLGCFFLVLALIAVIACLIARRRNMERARLELAARSSANWLDPKALAIGFQIAQSIGFKRLASLAAVGLLAAGLAKEWFGRDDAPPEADDTPES
jgi:hypothetical protein